MVGGTDWTTTGQVDFSSIPVRTFSLDQAPEAFELAAQGPGPELRMVVPPQRELLVLPGRGAPPY